MRVRHINPHPLNREIYELSNIEDLVFSIREKGLLQPLTINQHKEIISGHRRFAAIQELGWKEVNVEVVETTGFAEETELLIHYNKQREKTYQERLNEADIMRPILYVGQGKRTDLSTSVLPNKGSNKTGRDAVAKAIGISSSQLGKLEYIRKRDPDLIELIDKGQGTVHQVYTRLQGRQKDEEALEKRKNANSKLKPTDDFRIFIKTSAKLPELNDGSVQMIFTSPPYWSKRTFAEGSLGTENTSAEFVNNLVNHLQDCHRVLQEQGSFFLNMGDSRDKNGVLQNIPHKLAIGLEQRGWLLRNTIVWHKKNPKISSSKTSLTSSYDFIFHFVKNSQNYRFYQTKTEINNAKKKKEIRLIYHREKRDWTSKDYTPLITGSEDKNLTDYWTPEVISTATSRNIPSENGITHPATFPQEIVLLPLLQTTDEGDLVLDPFSGSHTTGRVANRYGRRYVGYDIHPY